MQSGFLLSLIKQLFYGLIVFNCFSFFLVRYFRQKAEKEKQRKRKTSDSEDDENSENTESFGVCLVLRLSGLVTI